MKLPYEKMPSLEGLIAARAQRAPMAPALLAPGRPGLTYAGLLRQLRLTVASLSEAGVAPGERIAIVLPNGAELAVATLAAAVHGVSAPLNPAYGAEELRFGLRDLRVGALILHEADRGPAREVAREQGIRCLEATWNDRSPAGAFALCGRKGGAPAEFPIRQGDDIALVLHTSGTTARPKIVPLSQRNLCRSAASIATNLALVAEDRCLNVMPLFHVHGLVGALLASLWAGASIACAPGMDAAQLAAWLTELGPTWYTAVPTMHEAVLRQFSGPRGGTIAHRLRFVRSCSAALPAKVAGAMEKALGVPVIEAYGMTEAAHQVASNPLPPLARKPGSVGVATGIELAIMDEEGHLLAPGRTGEIVVRGESVMAGYEANPEANRAAFVGGWFRTGDEGRLDPEGYLTISGRLKEIINRGGEKVSPADVEKALLEHEAVRCAAAFSVPHPTLGEDLAAAVILREGTNIAEEALRGFLFGRLSDFKIPSRVIVVDEIPLGATGKIQRTGLAERLADRLLATFIAPRGDTEALVAALFSEVLGIERIGAADNFFSLGGDSLRGMQLLARLRARRGIDLPAAALFRMPTVAEFARELDAASSAARNAAPVPPLVRRPRREA